MLDWPGEELRIRTLGHAGKLYPGDVSSVTLLGSKGPVVWEQKADALVVRMPKQKPCEYYKQVETDIQAGAKRLPLTVSGDVAWVAAAPGPKHIRLTLVDSGYINPHNKTAVITFGTVTPVAVIDILTNQRITVEDGKTAPVPVPCGLFRFLDVTIQEAL